MRVVWLFLLSLCFAAGVLGQAAPGSGQDAAPDRTHKSKAPTTVKPALDSSAQQAPTKPQAKPAIQLEPADPNAPSPRDEKSGDPDVEPELPVVKRGKLKTVIELKVRPVEEEKPPTCLLYTSDAADE